MNLGKALRSLVVGGAVLLAPFGAFAGNRDGRPETVNVFRRR
jgi:hypothetical protein